MSDPEDSMLNLTIKIPDICKCTENCYCKKGIVCANKCICSDINCLKVYEISSYGPKSPDYQTPVKKKIKKNISFDKEIHILEFKENDVPNTMNQHPKLKIVFLISPRASPKSPRSSPKSQMSPRTSPKSQISPINVSNVFS
jgi:hypothetical protein